MSQAGWRNGKYTLVGDAWFESRPEYRLHWQASLDFISG
jgi:hypothetical protein